jgi:UDP-N-acetylmuramoyl-L-alanyl-D-glutamate--2,6-diaminopimelate ligase
VRAVMGPIASVVAGEPSRQLRVLGVTGTNGKTTVVHLLGAVMAHAGRPHLVIGTLTGARTTPEAPELQAALRAAVDEGVEVVAMEISSHALDHHGTMEAYFAAKARLFTPELAERAVVCTDDPHGRLLRDSALIPTVGISLDEVADLDLAPTGTTFTWRGQRVVLPMPGRFNVRNALVAAEMALASGLPAATVAAGLSSASPVPGRVEPVVEGQDFSVVVDYAHTPDGLDQVIAALREVAPGRLLVVFGCGGDRDTTKRAPMGAAAAAADVVVLTSDNPRSEDPGAIIGAVRDGIPPETDLIVEPDREAAIGRALGIARPGDTVLVAGKGHETTQDLGDRVVPFDDREVARRLLRGGPTS